MCVQSLSLHLKANPTPVPNIITLIDKRLHHGRKMHTATLASQEWVAEIMARSCERIASSNEQAMQAVLAALPAIEDVLIPLGGRGAGRGAPLGLAVGSGLRLVFLGACSLPRRVSLWWPWQW